MLLLHISVSGARNVRFKLRAAVRSHTNIVAAEDVSSCSSASIADFFNSFESHRKSTLVSMAALHCIQVPEKTTIESLRTAITEHILSGQSPSPNSLPSDLSLPSCADVCDEWQGNNLDPDLQVHILTAIYGSKITPNSLRRVLSSLKIEHDAASNFR
jgi:hypothetical protein